MDACSHVTNVPLAPGSKAFSTVAGWSSWRRWSPSHCRTAPQLDCPERTRREVESSIPR